MGIEIAAGTAPRPTPLAVVKPAADAKPAAAPGVAPADTVVLSPQAQAMKALLPEAGEAGAAKKTEAETKAEEVFMDAVKEFFVKTMGLDRNKAGKINLNKEALHYILRNTVLGALAPPSLLKDQGIDFTARPPQRNGPLAEITIDGKERVTKSEGKEVKREKEPALARVMFDPAAMEELARTPKKAKDTDRDGLFTHLDLLPATRDVPTGKRIENGPRFDEADKRFAKQDEAAGIQLGVGVKRTTLTDGQNRPFFMTRLRGDVEKPLEATAGMCFGLLQFARGATF